MRTQGVAASPALELTATTVDGQTGIFGDTLNADSAEVAVRVRGAAGQLLVISKDGTPVDVQPIAGDDNTHTFTATRDAGSGPLGTFWRVDTVSPGSPTNGPYFTTIANPVFLAGSQPIAPPGTAPDADDGAADRPTVTGDALPATGATAPLPLAGVAFIAAVLAIKCASRASR